MKSLILDPKKISFKKKDINIFINGCFKKFAQLNYKKKFKFKILIQNPNTKFNSHNKIFKNFLKEIFPQLNKIHKINWNYNAWQILIGPWLHFYIFIINDRIASIKKIKKLTINFENKIKFQKKNLISLNFSDFKKKSSTLAWNEILIKKITLFFKNNKINENRIYNINEKKFLKQNKIETYYYHFLIFIIKIAERFLCFNNKYLFYNTYISNKLKLLHVNLLLNNFPFQHSFNFFNNYQTKDKFNLLLRNKIKFNFAERNINLKILKSLFVEMLPTIYLEGFKHQKHLATKSHLPKKIKKIFTSSAYEDSIFKFWLANQINNGAKLYHGQHGAGFIIYNKNFYYDYETLISKKRFTFGLRAKKTNEINVGNYLINKRYKMNITKYNHKFLVVLPRLDIYKPFPFSFSNFDNNITEVQKLINNLDINKISELNFREHPKNINRNFNFEEYLKLKSNNQFLDNKKNIESSYNKHSLIVFVQISTDFYKLISQNKPCLVLISKIHFNNLSKKTTADFKKLLDAGLIFIDGVDLAKKINSINDNLFNWWENKNLVSIKKNFCKNYSDPNFDHIKFVKNLL